MVFNKQLSLCWSLINDDLFHLVWIHIWVLESVVWTTFQQLISTYSSLLLFYFWDTALFHSSGWLRTLPSCRGLWVCTIFPELRTFLKAGPLCTHRITEQQWLYHIKVPLQLIEPNCAQRTSLPTLSWGKGRTAFSGVHAPLLSFLPPVLIPLWLISALCLLSDSPSEIKLN